MKRAKELTVVWPYAALFLILLWPLLLFEKSFTLSDYSVQHLPWAVATWEAAQRGALPLWTNSMALGFPLFAEGQCAALYFWNWFGYRMLPLMWAYTWSIPAHVLIGGLGMVAYARRLRLSREAAVIAATAFCFSSSYAGCFYNTGSLRTLCWLPVLLWLLERLRAGKGQDAALSFLALCLIVWQQWCAGFSQMAVYAFAFLALHEAFVLLESRRAGRAFFLASALLLGTLAAWPQIAPTLELIGLSVRSAGSVGFALWGSAPPVSPVALMYPEWGTLLRVSFYAGLVPLFLACTLFFTRRDAAVRRYAVLFIVFFLLALGKYNPLYRVFVEMFSLTFLRNPSKFLFFSVYSLCVLAAYGYDGLVTAVREKGRSTRIVHAVLTLATAVWLLPTAAQALTRAFEAGWPRIRQWLASGLVAEKGAVAKDPSYYTEKLDAAFRSLPGIFSYKNWLNTESALLASVTAAVFVLFLRKKIGPARFYALIGAVLVWDLAVFGFSAGTGFIGNAGAYVDTAPTVEMELVIQHTQRDPGLLVEFVKDARREIFPPNLGMTYGVRHAGGYSPLLVRPYEELVGDLGIADASLGRPAYNERAWRTQRGLLNLIGARYVHSDVPLEWPGWELIEDARDFYLYENRSALPVLVGYTRWRAVPDAAERLRTMKGAAFDAAEEAVLSDPSAASGLESTGEKNALSFHIMPQSVSEDLRFHVTAGADVLVMVRMTAYPGWTLELDGEEARWTVVNHAFLGFPLKKGDHDVRLVFRPTSWPRAWRVSWCALALALLGTVLIWRKK